MSNRIKLSGFKRPEVIDMTPTFEEAVKLCCMVLRDGTPEGQRQATEELMRYGRELDRLKAQSGTAFDPSDTPVA